MRWNPLTRRAFLRGPGKAALILPVLPSLLSKRAEAQAAANRQKNFIGVPMHNAITDMYSTSEGTPSIYMPVFKDMLTFRGGKHPIHYKNLADTLPDNGGRISKLFDADFNPYLSKMLMLQGFDWLPIPFRHHSSHFGNCNNIVPGSGDTGAPNPAPVATIDQVIAHSPNFYKNRALLGKSVTWSASSRESNWYESHTFANPDDKIHGAVVAVDSQSDPSVLWDKFFGKLNKPDPAPGPSFESTLVDLVLADYKAFSSSPRLGKNDRQRLDQHIALLHETEKSVKGIYLPLRCDNPPQRLQPPAPASLADRQQLAAVFNNIVVSLISCGLCHTFLGHFYSMVHEDPDYWHRWSHHKEVDPVTNEYKQNQSVIKDVVLDLVKKLDGNGFLDDSLVAVPNEHSKKMHETWNIPVVTFGSAGGVLKTGQYIDYRDMASGDDGEFTRFGYPMNQMLANMLMAMGVPAAEFEPLNRDSNALFSPAVSGYGANFIDPDHPGFASYNQKFKGHNLSDWLPLIKA